MQFNNNAVQSSQLRKHTMSPPPARYIWKIVFAAVALADITYTFYLMQDDNNSTQEEVCPITQDDTQHNRTNITFIYEIWNSGAYRKPKVSWASPIFCLLCLVEAVLRACDARSMALHNRALDELEQKMLQLAHRSHRQLSKIFGGDLSNTDRDDAERLSFIDRWMKFNRSCWTWIPAVTTFIFWILILPTEIEDFRQVCGNVKLRDSALMTKWLIMMSRSIAMLSLAFGEFVDSIIWTKIIPYRIHKQPQRFIKRTKVVLQGIRFVRFAGPLARMGLKLQDQLRTMWKTRRQSKKSELRKKQHVASPSLIFSDIQQLKSLAKIQTSLARIPSFTLSSPALENIASSVKESYIKRRADAKRISQQIAKLHEDFLGGGGAYRTAEIYERIVKTTNELTASLKADKSMRNRYLMAPRSLLSSRRYLISPRTRFSIAWRVTVTNCLMLEIFRLCASWHLSETFTISLSQVVAKLLVECKTPEKTKNLLVFISDRINEVRDHIFDALPILGQKPVDIAVCVPSGPQAMLIMQFGSLLERFIDTVVFLDIFVWFLTGEIDIDTHLVVPKPFITRCIIPGTLVQVLDHPTLPTLLPNLLRAILKVSKTIGYSRLVRWALAMAPASKILVFDPLKSFFFRHIKEDEGLMHYAESVGMISPERKFGHGSTINLFGMDDPNRTFLRRYSSNTMNNTSQVGLAFDFSPEPSRQDLKSMVSTDVSTTSEMKLSESFAPHSPPLRPGILNNPLNTDVQPTLIPMSRSPSKNGRSVHFGFLDSDDRLETDLTSHGDFSVSFS